MGGSGYLGKAVTENFIGLYPSDAVIPIDLVGTEITADLTDSETLSAAFEAAVGARKIDSLTVVNCVSSAVFTPSSDRTMTEVKEVLMANIGTTIASINVLAEICERLACPGQIVNVSSIFSTNAPRFEIYGDFARRSSEVYGASKAGVEQLTRYYAKLLGPRKIRVNCVAPGGIYDPTLHTAAFGERYGEATALGRMVHLDEVVNAIGFLASDLSSGITGAVLNVDCGYGL